ncbi:MAG TPA: M20 family metallopeptidase [Clostridia bacterium]|nr:M20 family metallopeptidase [Clostridia bacterium]
MITIDEKVKALKDEVIDIRRRLHRIPEPGLLEYETTRYICESLSKIGINCEIGPGGTGVIAYVEGRPGAGTVAFRADIDALSVEEQTGVEYCSQNKGYMHACGHDGHTAILLGFAKLLKQLGKELQNNVLLIFQPAEEGPGGAETIVNAGILEKYNVGSIFGLHIFPDLEEGKIGSRPGALMAQTGEFDLLVKGRSCHGAMPHKGNDAIVAASDMVMALNTIVSRCVDPIEPAVVTVGRMVCGERRNVIAAEAVMEGTIRAFNEATYNILRGRIIKLVGSVSDAYGCEGTYEFRDMYPAVHNDAELYELLAGSVDKGDFVQLNPLTLAEDFSYYQKRVTGLYLMLGSRNEEKGYVYPLHSNKFNFNEEILILGIQMFYNLIKRNK